MLRRLTASSAVLTAALVFAAPAAASPADECVPPCSTESDFYECLADCLQG
ncbi:hypothetical protein JDV09_06915 [Mycobacterium sp. Y57]|nr:hypothetical protein [Mycolicibacterium xanthum]